MTQDGQGRPNRPSWVQWKRREVKATSGKARVWWACSITRKSTFLRSPWPPVFFFVLRMVGLVSPDHPEAIESGLTHPEQTYLLQEQTCLLIEKREKSEQTCLLWEQVCLLGECTKLIQMTQDGQDLLNRPSWVQWKRREVKATSGKARVWWACFRGSLDLPFTLIKWRKYEKRTKGKLLMFRLNQNTQRKFTHRIMFLSCDPYSFSIYFCFFHVYGIIILNTKHFFI